MIITSKSLALGALLALLLTGCTSNQEHTGSLISLWTQGSNEEQKRSALDKVHQEAAHEAQTIAQEQQWTDLNDETYRQALKSTDIVFDEQSGQFVQSSSSQSERERLLLKSTSVAEDALFNPSKTSL